MADRIYTKEDLEKYMQIAEDYAGADLADVEKAFMNLVGIGEEKDEKGNPVEEGLAIQDLRAFVDGSLGITPDAYDKMEEFIKLFAGGYSNPRIKALEAKAKAKLNELKEKKVEDRVIPEATKQDRVIEEIVKEYRDPSMYSDQNEFLLDELRVTVLRDMGKAHISDDELVNLTPERAIDILQTTLPTLKDNELSQMESRMTNKMLSDDELFELIPPRTLAQKYNEVKAQISSEQDDTKKQELSAKQEKLADRIDILSAMLVTRERNGQDLFFDDVTNIADAHEGYKQMFAARKPDLEEMAKSADEETKIKGVALLQAIDAGEKLLDNHIIKEYDNDWNLSNIAPEDASKLDSRFEEIESKTKDVEVEPETLALVSNFKFLGEDGQVEPQFIDKDGNQTDVYSEGAKVIEGSKLDKAILLTKQNVMLENLGSSEEITPEFLAKEVSEKLGTTLYALHVNDEVAHGALEKPDQLTNPKYLNAFMAKLADIEHPMKNSNLGFEDGVNALVNQTGAYASRLAQKLSKDPEDSTQGRQQAVVTKLFAPISKIDHRAKDRTVDTRPSKREVRIEMAKRLLKGGASAFLISGTLTTFGAMTAADVGLTAATGGLNKFAGAGIGALAGITATAVQIHRWRKQQKAQGKKAGLREIVKQPRLVAAIATTALASTAIGFAATGNPGVASKLGIAALTIGTANGVISNTANAKQMGLSTAEAVGWGVAQGAVNVLAAMGGRTVGTQFVDYMQAHHNPHFGHWTEETPGSHKGPYHNYEDSSKTHAQIRMDGQDGTVSEGASDYTDGSRYSEWTQKVQALHGYNDTAHTNMLNSLNDAATQPGNEWMNNLDSSGNVTSNADILAYKVYQAKILGLEGANDLYANLASGTPLTPDNLVALQNIENQVDVTGHVLTNGQESWSYRNQIDPGYQTKNVDIPGAPAQYIPNDQHPMVGMFGVDGKVMTGMKKLKDRAGALLDRIGLKKKTIIVPGPIIPDPIIPDPKKPYEPPETTVISSPLVDEYKIVHGIEPNKSEFVRYKTLVTKEYHEDKEQGKTKAETFDAYVQERVDNFNNTYGDKATERANTTRETMWKTNLAYKGEKLESKNVTLRHFAQLAQTDETAGRYAEIKAAHDSKRSPTPKGKKNRPTDGTFDIAESKTSGQTKNDGKGQHTQGLPKVDGRS